MSIVTDSYFYLLGIKKKKTLLFSVFFPNPVPFHTHLFFNNKCFGYKDAISAHLFESINDFFEGFLLFSLSLFFSL